MKLLIVGLVALGVGASTLVARADVAPPTLAAAAATDTGADTDTDTSSVMAPERCALEDASLRGYLGDQAARIRRWKIAWGVAFAAGATFEYSLVAAQWNPFGEWDDDARAGALAGAIKASVGVVSKLVLPLKTERAAAPTGDPCVDLANAETALRRMAKRQRRSFYLNHLGGLAVNLTGVLVLGLVADTWKQALMSFVIGAPIGLVSTYTMPRGAWKTVRTPRFTMAAAPMVVPGGGGGLVLAGSF